MKCYLLVGFILFQSALTLEDAAYMIITLINAPAVTYFLLHIKTPQAAVG